MLAYQPLRPINIHYFQCLFVFIILAIKPIPIARDLLYEKRIYLILPGIALTINAAFNKEWIAKQVLFRVTKNTILVSMYANYASNL